MIQLKQVLGAWLLASVLLPTVAAHTATYYVATTGNNSNPGTENKPFRTIAYAVSTMVAGDTTYVMDGTYNEGVIRFKRSGTQSAPIKLLNYPEHAPKIVFTDPDALHRIQIEHESGHNKPIGWITIEGFELTNGHDGIKQHNLHDAIIRRNWIHDNKFMGIVGSGTRVLVDRNRINHNGWFAGCAGSRPDICNLHHGIYTNGSYWTITNNLIYDNLSYGITQNGSGSSVYDPAKYASPEFAGAANWVIAHNTFAYSNYRAGIVVWGGATQNTRIENNIFYENAQKVSGNAQAITFCGCNGSNTTSGVQIRNNHAYATLPGATGFISGFAIEGTHYTQSGNVINVSSPGFVHAPATIPDSPKFALIARSPAIDAGSSPSDEARSNTPRTDFDDVLLKARRTDFVGMPRPQGRAPDIGAYEYVADADAKPPTAPTALIAQ